MRTNLEVVVHEHAGVCTEFNPQTINCHGSKNSRKSDTVSALAALLDRVHYLAVRSSSLSHLCNAVTRVSIVCQLRACADCVLCVCTGVSIAESRDADAETDERLEYQH